MMKAFYDPRKDLYYVALLSSENLYLKEYHCSRSTKFLGSRGASITIEILVEDCHISFNEWTRKTMVNLGKVNELKSPELLSLLATSLEEADFSTPLDRFKETVMTELLLRIAQATP